MTYDLDHIPSGPCSIVIIMDRKTRPMNQPEAKLTWEFDILHVADTEDLHGTDDTAGTLDVLNHLPKSLAASVAKLEGRKGVEGYVRHMVYALDLSDEDQAALAFQVQTQNDGLAIKTYFRKRLDNDFKPVMGTQYVLPIQPNDPPPTWWTINPNETIQLLSSTDAFWGSGKSSPPRENKP